MKKDPKPSTPPIAAHSTGQKNHKPAPPPAADEPKARVSRAAKGKCIESLVLDRISDGVVAFDRAMTPIYVNERAAELLGREPADLIGKNLWADYPDPMQTPFAQACQSALETQTVTAFDGHFLPAQDSWLEGRIYPSQDGLSVIFTGAAQSQQGRIERRRRREDRYQILFDEMQEGFALAHVILDENREPRDYRILEVNAAMTRFLGKSREELVGHTASEVFAFDDQDSEIVQRAGRVALGEEPFFIEDYSEILNRSFRIHIFSPGHGQFACLFSDITEAKRTERALRKSEEKFSRAFHLSPSAMGIMRTSDAKFVDINESLLNMFGLSREQVIGQGARDLGITISDEDKRSITRVLQEKGTIINHELSTHGPSGMIQHMLLSVEAIEIENEPCVLVAAVDITERKQAEEKILDISKFPGQNPNPIMRFTREGELLYANQAAAPLLADWNGQHGQILPTEMHELLSSVSAQGTNVEIEIEGIGRIFSCLLVPIQDTNYVNFYLRDITSRKQAEESLQAIISQTTAGITRIDPDGTLTFVNKTVCDMFGYSEADLLGKSIWDLSHPDDIAKGKRLLKQLAAEGGSFQIETRFIRQNGSIIWVSVGTSPLRDASGSIYAAAGILVDITRRKFAEEALLDSARRTLYLASLSDAVRTLSDPLEIQAEAARMLGAHLKASRVTYLEIKPDQTFLIQNGYSDGVDELTGQFQLLDCLPASMWPKFQEGRSMVTADVQSDPRYNEAQRLAHEAVSARSQVLLPFLRNGELIGTLCVQQSLPREWRTEEISLMEETAERTHLAIERAHTEEQLRVLDERLRALVNQATAGLALVDRNGKRTFVNQCLCEMTGYTSEELLQMHLQDITHPDDVPLSTRLFERMMNEGIPFDIEQRFICKDGSVIWVHNSMTYVRDAHGRPESGISITVDINLRKHMEHELVAAKNALDAELLGMNRLYDFSTRLTAASDIRAILEQALDGAMELQNADFGNFHLYNQATNALELAVHRGFDEEFLAHFRTINDQMSASGRALNRHERVIIEDVETDPAYVPHLPAARAAGYRAVHAMPLLGNDGKPFGILAVHFREPHQPSERELRLMDLYCRQVVNSIERKQAEEVLRQSEELFATVFRSSPTPMVLTRIADAKITDVNEVFCQLFGYSREEILGHTSVELGLIDPGPRREAFEKLKETGSLRDIEQKARDRHGRQLEILLSIETLYVNGDPYALTTIIDITERKRMEQALKDEQELLAKIFESIPVMLTVYDPAVTMLKVNTQFEKSLGWSGTELANISIMEACYPDPGYRSQVQQFMDASEDGRWMDIQMRTRQGQTLETSWSNIRLSNNMQVGIGLDISERKQREEALRARTEEVEALLEVSPIGIFVSHDPACAHITGNPAGYELVRMPHESGANISKSAPPDERPNYRVFRDGVELSHNELPMQSAARLGMEVEAETLELRFENGSHKFLYAYAKPLFDEQGHTRGAIAAMMDITERKHIEDQIRNLNAELQSRIDEMDSLMAILPVGVWVGNHDCSVMTGNHAAYSILNLDHGINASFTSPEPEMPAGIRLLVNGQEVLPEDAPMQRVARSGKPLLNFEHELLLPNGEQKSIFTSIAPLLDSDGKVRKVIGAYTDITNRKKMENALQYARARAEQTAYRIAQLQKVTAALSAAATLSQVAEIVTEQGAPAFGAVSSSMMLLTEDEQALEIMYSTSPQGLINPYARFPVSLNVPAADVIRSGQPVWLESRQQYLERYPHLADQIERWGHQAAIAIPMEYKERVVGVLTMSFDRVVANTPEDREYALTLARQAAQALERARAEEALRESEARFRAIVSQATAGIVRKDASGKLLFVNQAFCEMLGYTASELLDKTMWQLTQEEDVEKNKRLYSRLMVEGTPFQLEKRLIRRDGSILWATVSVSPVLDATGRPQSAVSVYTDISDRKRAEQQLHQLNLELEQRVQRRTSELQSAYEFLRESEATSRLILESMPDAIVITNEKGFIVHCNAQVENLFGYSPGEVLGQPVETLLPERFHKLHVEHRQSYEAKKYRRIMGLGRELFGRRKDNSEFPVDVMLSPMSNDTTWDVMVTIRDNTEQKQAQEALRISEEKLRTLFEILPVGISFLGRDARIVDLNSALSNILGVPKQHLLKGSFKSRRYIRPDGMPMPPTEFASTRALTEKKTIYNVETGIVRDNGEVVWTTVNAAPVQVADVEAVVVTVDITERKAVEEALNKHRERLRVLSRRLVEVQEEERRALARELHDRVGQNLAALNLNLNILRSQFSEEVLKHMGTRLDDSVNLVKQILTITRNVMDDLRSNVLDDYGLEAALSEYTEKFTQRYGIPVVTDKPANPIPRLNAGVEMTLLRIAQEALTNVARHAQATQVTLSLNIDRNTVHMAIKDNGSGILSWQKANQPGSHGLRIIRERAEAFGGSLQVNSAYKKGTQIEVRIPGQGSI